MRITSYVAAGLGVLSFIWGFLSWFKDGPQGIGGYSVSGAGAGAVVGLSLAAGLIAAGAVLEKKDVTLTPTALALASFLVSVGLIIGKGSVGPSADVGTGVGLILALITTLLQTAALGYGWAITSGRVSAPSQTPKVRPAAQQPNPWQQGGSGAQGGYSSGPSYPPAGYQPQGSGGYQAPQGSPYGQPYQQPGQQQPGQQQHPGQYGPPTGPGRPGQAPTGNPYGPPPGGYGPPSQTPGSQSPQAGSTSSLPAQGGNPYQPPSQQSPSQQPPSQQPSDGGYGEATRHIPRYPGVGSGGQDDQQGS